MFQRENLERRTGNLLPRIQDMAWILLTYKERTGKGE